LLEPEACGKPWLENGKYDPDRGDVGVDVSRANCEEGVDMAGDGGGG